MKGNWWSEQLVWGDDDDDDKVMMKVVWSDDEVMVKWGLKRAGCLKWWSEQVVWSDDEVMMKWGLKRAGCLKWWWSDDELRFEASRLFEQKEIDEVSRKGNWWSEQVVAAKEVGLAKSFCLFTFLAVLLSHKAGPVVQATEQSSIGACCRADGLRVSKGATTTRHLTNTYTNLGW